MNRLPRNSGVQAILASGRASLCGATGLQVCTVCVEWPGRCQGRKSWQRPPCPVKSPPPHTGSASSQEQVHLWALGSPVVLFPVSPESARGSGPSALSGPIRQGHVPPQAWRHPRVRPPRVGHGVVPHKHVRAPYGWHILGNEVLLEQGDVRCAPFSIVQEGVPGTASGHPPSPARNLRWVGHGH